MSCLLFIPDFCWAPLQGKEVGIFVSTLLVENVVSSRDGSLMTLGESYDSFGAVSGEIIGIKPQRSLQMKVFLREIPLKIIINSGLRIIAICPG